MAKKFGNKGVLRLPVQTLNWGLVPKNTKKIFLQFELTLNGNGSKKFGLVAYPANKSGKAWVAGKKITLVNKKGARLEKLSLPITLGNLELSCKGLGKMNLTKNSKLIFTPGPVTKNPHATYSVIDDGSQGRAMANPSPPARPLEA